jgi:hypothetical protein
MKNIIKNNLLSLILLAIVSASVVYAANITTTTQTANNGDVLTHDWVNAVNQQLNTVSAAGASDVDCNTNEILSFSN